MLVLMIGFERLWFTMAQDRALAISSSNPSTLVHVWCKVLCLNFQINAWLPIRLKELPYNLFTQPLDENAPWQASCITLNPVKVCSCPININSKTLPQIGTEIPTAGIFNASTTRIGVVISANAVFIHKRISPFFDNLFEVKYSSTWVLISLKKSFPLLMNPMGLVAMSAKLGEIHFCKFNIILNVRFLKQTVRVLYTKNDSKSYSRSWNISWAGYCFPWECCVCR